MSKRRPASPARPVTCKLCGASEEKSDNPVRNLDEMCDDLGETYKDIFYYCFGINISVSGVICQECIIRLLETLSFKSLAVSVLEAGSGCISGSLTTITKTNSKTSNSSQKSSIQSATYITQILDKKSRRPSVASQNKNQKAFVSCKECGCKYRVMQNVKMAADFVCCRCKIKWQNSGKTTEQCVECDRRISKRLMKRHMEMHEKSELKGRCRLRIVAPGESKKECGFPKMPRFPQKYACKRCPNKYNAASKLLSHVQDDHGVKFGNVCHICKTDYKRPQILERHLKIHHNPNMVKECDVCRKVFYTTKTYQKHYLIHL